MKGTPLTREALIDSIFSDESGLFRTPAEPEPGAAVTVRVRLAKGANAVITLLYGIFPHQIRMYLCKTDACFDWYEARIICPKCEAAYYAFLVVGMHGRILYQKTGATLINGVPALDPSSCFRILPGFHVPGWSKGAIQYQILADRFRNSTSSNDVMDREYFYGHAHVRHAVAWEALPGADDYRCFYGGDLLGVLEKLDYLQSLGVEAIYFNPLFISPSSHGYDTQDYDHINPHLTNIVVDNAPVLRPEETSNANAARYIQRTTDPKNLKASDAFFARFCQELHRRGMRIILDGVFNHCGSFNKWMDREGIYSLCAGRPIGAYNDPRSPYRNFFRFHDHGNYECWWDIETLPKLQYESSALLCEKIFRIAEKWISPPYSVDGWRLDVAADLGHSQAFNHQFWKEFRRRVKAINPEVLILAEHYGDPCAWLGGDEWDTVMNYDAFMEPVTYFLTGMEKHSDYRKDDLYQNGGAFFDTMRRTMARMPWSAVQCAMNELSNHDHSRFLTRTNGRPGRLQTAGSAAASEGIRYGVFREAAVIQMTWPGAPTIYYGDEAGMTGWTDPDNRRAYPWGHENEALIELYRALARLRHALPVLKNGSMKPLCWGYGFIAYARFDARDCAVVLVNNLPDAQPIDLPLRNAGIADGTVMDMRFSTGEGGFNADASRAGTVRDGRLRITLPRTSAVVLAPEKPC